jgi:hypothetical protein
MPGKPVQNFGHVVRRATAAPMRSKAVSMMSMPVAIEMRKYGESPYDVPQRLSAAEAWPSSRIDEGAAEMRSATVWF